jgi:hydroxypyruvate isomerase
MWDLSPNIVMMFGEVGDDPVQRVRAAAAAGVRWVDFWAPPADCLAMGSVLREIGVRPRVIKADSRFLLDAQTRNGFRIDLANSLRAARELGCEFIVATSGPSRVGADRAEQHAAIVAALSDAAELVSGTGVRVLLENVNSTVDHPGTFLDTTQEVAEIVREVGRPEIRILLDVYHAIVMGEDLPEVFARHGDLIEYVQFADAPGRHEPGAGEVDWEAVMRTMRAAGYGGAIGLEYRPTGDSARSMDYVRSIIERVKAERGAATARNEEETRG